jgi:hypothetical protein
MSAYIRDSDAEGDEQAAIQAAHRQRAKSFDFKGRSPRVERANILRAGRRASRIPEADEERPALAVQLEAQDAESSSVGSAEPLLDHRPEHGLLQTIAPTSSGDDERLLDAPLAAGVELLAQSPQGLSRGETVEIDFDHGRFMIFEPAPAAQRPYAGGLVRRDSRALRPDAAGVRSISQPSMAGAAGSTVRNSIS